MQYKREKNPAKSHRTINDDVPFASNNFLNNHEIQN